MKLSELSKELGVPREALAYHFRKWCEKNGRDPSEFKKKAERKFAGDHFEGRTAYTYYDVPDEAVPYLRRKAEEYLERRRKRMEANLRLFRLEEPPLKKKEETFEEKARRALERGESIVTYNSLGHEEVKLLLKLAEEHGKRLYIGSDDAIVIDFL